MGKSALVLGATGVVGRELVRELCESPGYDEVEAWVRREIGFCRPKLRARIVDFEGISDTRLLERLAAAVFKLLPACVLGKFRPLSGASIARCERDF
ncbi:hypothetical protein [uncultured Campylobacter sp.]|uniref:hypothetical protein n=1 Tax=uncultured Campylobacter sp. TaxID=218934 RepID=UPI002623CE52|nr:hypothetical protein [uncultured Campylobacter sp.]